MSTEHAVTVTACTKDTRAMLAISAMFALLAGAEAPRVLAESQEPPEATGAAPEVNENTPVSVDTAAVFGGPPTLPRALVEPVVPLVTEHPTPPVAVAAPPAPVAAPSAPAPTPAPAPAAAAPPAPPAGVALDKNGLPWDERINTSNKAKTAPGAWKRKPGITDEAYNSVIAELKAIMGAPAPAPVAAPPAAPVAPPATPVAAAPAPPVAPVAAAPVVTPAPTAATPSTYMELLHVVGAHLAVGAAQPITAEEVTGVCATHGLPTGLPGLASRPDLIPAVYQGCVDLWSTR